MNDLVVFLLCFLAAIIIVELLSEFLESLKNEVEDDPSDY